MAHYLRTTDTKTRHHKAPRGAFPRAGYLLRINPRRTTA